MFGDVADVIGIAHGNDAFGLLIEKREVQQTTVFDHKLTPLLLKRIAHSFAEGKHKICDRIVNTITCYTPEVAMKVVLDQHPLSIVLTSGTLSPLKRLEDEFGLKLHVR